MWNERKTLRRPPRRIPAEVEKRKGWDSQHTLGSVILLGFSDSPGDFKLYFPYKQ
jgi:hypothetical protein